MITHCEEIAGRSGGHKLVSITCGCGRKRTTRATKVRTGLVDSCTPCAHKKGVKVRRAGLGLLSWKEKVVRDSYGYYRGHARRRNKPFEMSLDVFRKLYNCPCSYCGAVKAKGVDRINSSLGYVEGNIKPCCTTCNFAKGQMSLRQFKEWVRRAYAHQNK